MKQEDVEHVYQRMRQHVIKKKVHAKEKGGRRSNEDIMPYAQQGKEEDDIDWTVDASCNQQDTKEQMIPQDVMKATYYMCLIEGKENQQLMWTVIL